MKVCVAFIEVVLTAVTAKKQRYLIITYLQYNSIVQYSSSRTSSSIQRFICCSQARAKRYCCKGFGFISFSPIWRNWRNRPTLPQPAFHQQTRTAHSPFYSSLSPFSPASKRLNCGLPTRLTMLTSLKMPVLRRPAVTLLLP